MNSIGDSNQAASVGEGAGLDPREAAMILEQAKRQARRQFDPQSVLAAVVLDLLHFLRGEGITILASIHDLHLVEGNFDTVLLLSPGEALRSGTPAEMLKPALLERAFNCPPDRHPVLVERAQMQSGRRHERGHGEFDERAGGAGRGDPGNR